MFYFTCIEMLRCRSDNDRLFFYAARQQCTTLCTRNTSGTSNIIAFTLLLTHKNKQSVSDYWRRYLVCNGIFILNEFWKMSFIYRALQEMWGSWKCAAIPVLLVRSHRSPAVSERRPFQDTERWTVWTTQQISTANSLHTVSTNKKKHLSQYCHPPSRRRCHLKWESGTCKCKRNSDFKLLWVFSKKQHSPMLWPMMENLLQFRAVGVHFTAHQAGSVSHHTYRNRF